MKLAVIVPLYNRQRMIVPAIRSLLRQSDAADLDIIVVDDGSTDESATVVRDIAQKERCVRLISQKNMGVTGARNTGLKNLSDDTKLVTFLDSDDISPAGRIAKRSAIPACMIGNARSAARNAARWPAVSPSKHNTGSRTTRHKSLR